MLSSGASLSTTRQTRLSGSLPNTRASTQYKGRNSYPALANKQELSRTFCVVVDNCPAP